MTKIRIGEMNNIKTTFIVALISNVCAHGFALTNVLHNSDNIAEFLLVYGAGLSSERWL